MYYCSDKKHSFEIRFEIAVLIEKLLKLILF